MLQQFVVNRPVACKQKYFNEKLITRDVTTGCVVAGENIWKPLGEREKNNKLDRIDLFSEGIFFFETQSLFSLDSNH